MQRKRRRNPISMGCYLAISSLILAACGSSAVSNATHSNSSTPNTQLKVARVFPLNIRPVGTENGVNFEITDNLIVLNQDGQEAYQ